MPARIKSLFLCASVALLHFVAANCCAQNVYQWTDAQGQVHFSTQPNHKDAVQKALPPLQRENLDSKIKAIKDQTPDNCVQHGGIDCSRGADGDGSVICLDGYRSAVMPFQFECLEARMQSEYFLLLDAAKNERAPHSRNLSRTLQDRKAEGFELTLRNLSGVEAKGIKVEFVIGRKEVLTAQGPETLAPFSTADYSYLFSELGRVPPIAEIEQSRYRVDCANCSGVLGAAAHPSSH